MPSEPTWPADYWSKSRFYYVHTPDGAWGVGDAESRRVLCQGLDKNDAAAAACLLNGDYALAYALLRTHEALPKGVE